MEEEKERKRKKKRDGNKPWNRGKKERNIHGVAENDKNFFYFLTPLLVFLPSSFSPSSPSLTYIHHLLPISGFSLLYPFLLSFTHLFSFHFFHLFFSSFSLPPYFLSTSALFFAFPCLCLNFILIPIPFPFPILFSAPFLFPISLELNRKSDVHTWCISG